MRYRNSRIISKTTGLLLAVILLLTVVLQTALAQDIIINEVDADTFGTDTLEFIELYDGGAGNTALDGLTVVLFNGSDDQSYTPVFDLDGYTTDGNGYFVIGTVPASDIPVASGGSGWLQNGADAVALFVGNDTDFPDNTPLTTVGLIDALVYDTNDGDDAGLLPLLNAGQPQINEDGNGDKDNHSNQRCPNGSGGSLNTDTYAQFIPTPSAVNVCCSCGSPVTSIHDIQGNGMSSPEDGNIHMIQGAVVGDFQTSSYLRGFFVQEEDTGIDADPTTSEGIFVYDGSSPIVDVKVGDVVCVNGLVDEYNDMTELISVTSVTICPGSGIASAATINMPVTNLNDWEYYEGMLINIPQILYATGNYYQGRYGEVDLSVGDRLDAPTNVVAPGAPANALQSLNNLSRIQLEDGRADSNALPVPYIGSGGTLRAGDTIPDLTGVLNYAYGVYEVHPTEAVNFNRVNSRDAVPADVGGTVKVASFNVLNYFTTIDDSGPICGPSSNLDCRGADNAAEFTRHRNKIIAAIVAMDADIIGLMEIENHPTDAALYDIINGLNVSAGSGTYDLLDTGPIGTDAIKVAFIYKPGVVTPIGAHAILDSSVDPTFNDTMNRPSLAQTFGENAGSALFTITVNHLKSKGSDCNSLGDPDIGDGQGNCNLTRTAAAAALVNWLATDPTGSGDQDHLIIGDLNSYIMEDPIVAIEAGGYASLLETLADPYSYVYLGQTGCFDHALATSNLSVQVSGATIWHINTDEPSVLDYNDYNQPAGLYNADQYRSSDHDPVIIGLSLVGIPVGESSDDAGDSKYVYLPGDTVYATGSGFLPVTSVAITVVADDTWTNGMTIPADITDDGMNTVITDASGNIPLTQIWESPLPIGDYDVVFNTGRDMIYNTLADAVHDSNHPGFIVRAPNGEGPTVGGKVILMNKFELLMQYFTLPMQLMMAFAL